MELNDNNEENVNNKMNAEQSHEKNETDVQEQCRRLTWTRKLVIMYGEYWHAKTVGDVNGKLELQDRGNYTWICIDTI